MQLVDGLQDLAASVLWQARHPDGESRDRIVAGACQKRQFVVQRLVVLVVTEVPDVDTEERCQPFDGVVRGLCTSPGPQL
ncbi:hypothetical protein ABQF34_12720 [Mycolicibacterium boenickei]